jgi:Putative esterase
MALRRRRGLVLLVALLAIAAGAASTAAQPAGSRRGSPERITVHGGSLEGNLEGDSPDRPVVVYLPPSYATEPRRRYPVLYFLHGYTATAEAYVKSLAIPESIDWAIAGGAREMIIVIPDAHSRSATATTATASVNASSRRCCRSSRATSRYPEPAKRRAGRSAAPSHFVVEDDRVVLERGHGALDLRPHALVAGRGNPFLAELLALELQLEAVVVL